MSLHWTKMMGATKKNNYWTVGVLIYLSKIFENILYNQIANYQTGFRKGFNPQNCLAEMIEKLRNFLYRGSKCAALLMGLSKTFDCLPHDLINASLHTYGFDMPWLIPLLSYWTDRYQGVKVNNSCSLWSLIKYGVLQGSIFRLYSV